MNPQDLPEDVRAELEDAAAAFREAMREEYDRNNEAHEAPQEIPQ